MKARPPRIAEWLLERFLPDGVVGESIVGDMREQWAAAEPQPGVSAKLRYLIDVVRILVAVRWGRSRPGTAGVGSGPGAGLGVDARQAARSLLRSPGFSAITAATLAIGIGATAAVFCVVDGVLLRPLPYQDPEALVSVLHTAPGIGAESLGLSTGTYFTFRDESRTLDGLEVWGNELVGVTGAGEPEEVEGVSVTPGMLSLLGVAAAQGRLFVPADGSRQSPMVVVLSDQYWRTRLGGDPSVLGRTITVEGMPVEIVGILPPGFRFLAMEPLLYFPMRLERAQAFVGSYNYRGIGRMRAGATIEGVRAELAELVRVAAETYPGGASVERVERMQLRPAVLPLTDTITGDVGVVLWLLLGAAAFLLLMGLANVANLFLVRAEGRHRDWTIRSALGASRARMSRLFFFESGLLAFAGLLGGIALADLGVSIVRAFGPANIPRLTTIGIDGHVIAFAALTAASAAVILGLISLFRYGWIEQASALVPSGRGHSLDRHRHHVRGGLAVIQLAFALTLVIGAGLMTRSLRAIWNAPTGFTSPEQILTFRIAVPQREAPDPSTALETHRRIMESVAALPGVTSIALSTSVPMDGRLMGNTTPVEERADETAPSRRYKFVSPGFFRTMGIPLVAGRDIDWRDTEGRHDVAIVSEGFALEYWGDAASAIGKRIAQNPAAGWREIVGVVGDIRDDGPTKEAPAIVYWPIATRDFWGVEDLVQRSLVYAIRTPEEEPLRLAESIRRTVWSINDRLPVADMRTEQSLVDRRTAQSSFVMLLLGVAAAIALVLGVVGLYGVLSYLVSTRSREIGIRLAIGAERTSVIGLFLREGASLAVLGVGAGIVLAAAVSRLMSSILFGIEPVDPLTYGAASVLLLVIAMLATGVPALRAAAIDPVRTLEAD